MGQSLKLITQLHIGAKIVEWCCYYILYNNKFLFFTWNASYECWNRKACICQHISLWKLLGTLRLHLLLQVGYLY